MVETASRITEERVDVDDLMKALCNTWNAGIFLTLDPGQKCPNQKKKTTPNHDSIKLKGSDTFAQWSGGDKVWQLKKRSGGKGHGTDFVESARTQRRNQENQIPQSLLRFHDRVVFRPANATQNQLTIKNLTQMAI
jgi:hypothetical protein